jgi:hypothetical protein
MLITTICPSCAAKLTISSYAEGKRISCIQCGHKFILNETANPAPVVLPAHEPPQENCQDEASAPVGLQAAEPSHRDWQDEPPVIRQQPPADSWHGEDSDEKSGGESTGWEFDGLDHSVSDADEWNLTERRSHDRGRINLAAFGLSFGVASLVCLVGGLSIKGTGLSVPIVWLGGSVASAYIGVHLSLFGRGVVRIVGVLLNLAIMLACVVWAIYRIRGS